MRRSDDSQIEAFVYHPHALHTTPVSRGGLWRSSPGLYNGTDYPFYLTELRGVDRDIAADCLDLLTLNTRGIEEVHRYVENGDAMWAAIIEDCLSRRREADV